MRAATRPSEALIAWIWKTQRVRGPLRCSNGRTVQVIFPGRVWGERQPDFQGALLAWESGELLRGDVEIHVQPRAWQDHGHHRDPAYNDVILHVVLDADGAAPTTRADGQDIPILALRPVLGGSLEQLQRDFDRADAVPDPHCQDQPARVTAVVEAAGSTRLLEKSAMFEADLEVGQPSQLLWRGVARALGYTSNAAAMTRLAEAVPYATVEQIRWSAREGEDRVSRVLAGLLGSAGLLPSQRGLWSMDALGERLEREWHGLGDVGWSQHLDADDWDLGRVRPANAPPRRLAALACLAVQWHGQDVVQSLARLVVESSRPAVLIKRFTVTAPSPALAALVDLRTALLPPMAGLVGRDRAIQIVVNAVLPLAHALGQTWDLPELSAAAQSLYAACPGAASSGLERGMASQLLGSGGRALMRGARRQQGLLHLYHTSCHRHACATCAGNGPIPRPYEGVGAGSSALTPLAMVPTRS